MAATLAARVEAMVGRRSFGDDHLDDRDRPDRGPAQEVIGEMAWLLRDTRGGMLLGGSVLSAITIGIGVDAAFSSSVLRPGAARTRRERIQLADTWTFITAACFLVCTAMVFLALPGRGAWAEAENRVSARRLSS